jgi:carbon-monoxide dehydrogenase medium subunit/6-hydroxypseudooxynicotine dehydrogenase subunit alpha
MKPAAVSFTRAHDPAEALELLHELGDEAKVIAGGQSLLPLMSLRFARPGHLVDVNRLDAYAGVREDGDGLVVGALTRHLALERAALAPPWAAFADAMPQVGHHPIRVRGTFGGSVSHADPTAELPLLVLTLGGTLVTESRCDGRRSIAAADFFRGPLRSDVRPDELLVEARFGAPPPGTVSAFEEFSERAGDFALASVCVAVTFDDAGTCTAARLGLGAVAGVPVRAPEAEAILAGSTLDEDAIAEAAEAARRACESPDTTAASAEFRRDLVATLMRRALRRAAARRTDAPR